MSIHRYSVEIELESYAATGRQAIEWALNSLLGQGMPSKLKVHVTRMTDDGKPDLGVRGGVYIANLRATRDADGESTLVAEIAKRPIQGTSAC